MQAVAVIFELPLHRHSAGEIHLVDALYLTDNRLDIVFGIFLNFKGGGWSIECVGQEGTRCLVIRLACANLGIGNPFGKLLPRLTHNG